jgi:hypothetical protein
MYDDELEKGEDEDSEVHATLRALLVDAASYVDEELSPEREIAGKYYRGELFGDEQEGRSKVVSRDVSDTVRAILPSMMRIFFGGERVMEFSPVGPEDAEMADQATDYVHFVFTRDNPGFMTLYAAIKDALLRRTGAIKTWWDDSLEVTFEDYEGLDDATLALLEEDPELEILTDDVYPDEVAQAALEAQMAQQAQQPGQPSAETLEPPPPPMLHDVSVRRTRKTGKIRAEAVPPEELLIARGARSFQDADVIGHRVELTVSALVALGYDKKLIEEHLDSDELSSNAERLARHPEDFSGPANDAGLQKVLYTEAWARLDEDDDGIAELRKYCCIGSNYKVLRSDPATHVPIADICPDPEPHRAIGWSIHDLVHDIQRIKSQILRGMLDSLAQTLNPRAGVVEGEVNMSDVLSNEVGAPIRMRRPGMYQPFETAFVGQAAFPALEYMDRLREKRTGITDATQGLDAATLQSTTASAVNATVEAAQQQIELIARIFAETGISNLYRNLLRLVVQHQDKPRMVRLRNNWVQMDPRSWNVDMDLVVDPALGSGTWEKRLQILALVAEKQEMLLQTLGPQNPLVSLGQYSNTLHRMLEAAGYSDGERYFSRLPLDFQLPQPPQGEGEDPTMALVGVQREEIQANIEKKKAELQLQQMETQARLQLDREKMLRDDDRERDRIEADAIIRAMEKGIDPGPILALMSRNRNPEHQGHFQ